MCFELETHIYKVVEITMQKIEYKRDCPQCGKEISYASLDSFRHVKPNSKCRYCCNVLRGKSSNRKGCRHTDESKKLISVSQVGIKKSMPTRIAMSLGQIRRCSDPDERRKMSERAKIAMHRSDVRSRHIAALHKTKWLVVKTDNGQLELLDKWNRLGFHFEPNYQVHTDSDLFYIDGYDKKKNVVLEYDSKYHKSVGQQKKDKVREQKIIDALQPKKFWRFDSDSKTMKNILEVA